MAPRETWLSENFGLIYRKCFGEDQGSKFHFPCFFLSQLSFQFFCGKDLRVLSVKSRFSEFIKDTLSYIFISNSARKI